MVQELLPELKPLNWNTTILWIIMIYLIFFIINKSCQMRGLTEIMFYDKKSGLNKNKIYVHNNPTYIRLIIHFHAKSLLNKTSK